MREKIEKEHHDEASPTNHHHHADATHTHMIYRTERSTYHIHNSETTAAAAAAERGEGGEQQ